MIAIVNVSKKIKPTGPHKYELRINSTVLAEFNHNREDSLSICLRKAADAHDKAKQDLLENLVHEGVIHKLKARGIQ